MPEENRAVQTGIVPPGGIPILDSWLDGRREIYASFGPEVPLNEVVETYNAQQLQSAPADASTFDGTMAQIYLNEQALAVPPPVQVLPDGTSVVGEAGASSIGGENADDFGIVSTPENP